jgi:MFS family permease
MSKKPLILFSLLLAAFVINLDTTIVNVALPTLVGELHASNTQLQWVVDAFSLFFRAFDRSPDRRARRVMQYRDQDGTGRF